MVSSRWNKRNNSILYTGMTIIGSIFALFWMLLIWFGLERNWVSLLITVLLIGAVFSLTFALQNRHANALIRVLKMEYTAVDFALRLLFKEKQIRFNRQTEEESTRIEFSGQSLTMTVQPYFLHNFVANQKTRPQPATLLTIRGLNEQNKAFAEMLADSIDEMAKQKARVGAPA
ncbi:hypothetical protein [Candidatus Leptofilum sp.]|uniref:hypothetical protein n=1 Tax=Candidatus Leptofilum sp. TaxID=3241576 RepID=UPI003B5ABEBB